MPSADRYPCDLAKASSISISIPAAAASCALSNPANDLVLARGRTLAFMVLALSQVVQAYNMRSDKSLFKIGPFSNGNLNLASLASVLLVAIVMFTPARIAFGLELLTTTEYLIGLGLAFVPLVIMEIAKLLGFIKHHNHK